MCVVSRRERDGQGIDGQGRDGGKEADRDGYGVGGDERRESEEAETTILKENKRVCL